MTTAKLADDDLVRSLHNALKQRLHLPCFRPGQLEAALAVFKGDDVVVKMRTGAGKSNCYVVPFICLRGLTIVITPLIALLTEQVSFSFFFNPKAIPQ